MRLDEYHRQGRHAASRRNRVALGLETNRAGLLSTLSDGLAPSRWREAMIPGCRGSCSQDLRRRTCWRTDGRSTQTGCWQNVRPLTLFSGPKNGPLHGRASGNARRFESWIWVAIVRILLLRALSPTAPLTIAWPVRFFEDPQPTEVCFRKGSGTSECRRSRTTMVSKQKMQQAVVTAGMIKTSMGTFPRVLETRRLRRKSIPRTKVNSASMIYI